MSTGKVDFSVSQGASEHLYCDYKQLASRLERDSKGDIHILQGNISPFNLKTMDCPVNPKMDELFLFHACRGMRAVVDSEKKKSTEEYNEEEVLNKYCCAQVKSYLGHIEKLKSADSAGNRELTEQHYVAYQAFINGLQEVMKTSDGIVDRNLGIHST
ncbi:hypothetical protein JQC92_21615 [Shewanella sp. 202IG2-18]|uniref:hypothetical protein n=1 Tax=Parashewanella hymeniacidonis TaxID=2807618 RepID=UPI001961DE26|nr:hypothetical protein [Parashewanella hymeniacidonis]MBM7074581.1 hypothetical protein [Parashewanella hymeniacidonis]